MSISFADYKRIDAVNNSSLKAMAKSPKHYRHYRDNPEDPDKTPSDAMVLGTAVHAAVLEPDRLPLDFVIWSGPTLPAGHVVWHGGNRRGKAWEEFKAANVGRDILTPKEVDAIENSSDAKRGKAWEAFRDANAGRNILTASQYASALAIRGAVRSDPSVAPYLEGPGDFERSVQWTDAETGLGCKLRLDRLAHKTRYGRVLVDLKTTRDADPRVFARQAANLGYAQQLAMYRDGLAAIGEPVDKVVIVLVETSAPYDSAVLVVENDTLQAGRSDYLKLLRRVAECREAGEWPGRYPTEGVLDMPSWWWEDSADIGDGEDGLDINMGETA